MILTPGEVATIANAIPKLIGVVQASRLLPDPQGPIADFIAQHAEFIAILERLANFFFPGAGTGIEVLLFIIEYSHQMDPQETDVWMKRQYPQG